LSEILDKCFRSETARHWHERLNAVSIPTALVKTLDKALSADQVLHRGMVLTLRSEAGSEVRVPGNPIKFDAWEDAQLGYPPHLGEHTNQVLSERLNLDETYLRTLQNMGVVSQFVPGIPALGVKSR
jgi:crotonobetainyl-CoA:carnitine CoA-transferase CaiB-like acyl-CoA transferase